MVNYPGLRKRLEGSHGAAGWCSSWSRAAWTCSSWRPWRACRVSGVARIADALLQSSCVSCVGAGRCTNSQEGIRYILSNQAYVRQLSLGEARARAQGGRGGVAHSEAGHCSVILRQLHLVTRSALTSLLSAQPALVQALPQPEVSLALRARPHRGSRSHLDQKHVHLRGPPPLRLVSSSSGLATRWHHSPPHPACAGLLGAPLSSPTSGLWCPCGAC